jgi:5-methylcytosine-specific restriction endonuclease McrA
MSTSIMDKLIVLKLNRMWQPVGFATVGKSVIDLCGDINSYALDIEYEITDNGPNFDNPTSMTPVDWDRWITLPVRPWDLVIHSPNLEVRVPTVLIARHFDKMPIREFKGRPTSRQIWDRDNGIDQYTGQALQENEASIDHVLPTSRGGRNAWENMVLTHKQTNYRKGAKTPEEAGLHLIRRPVAPKPVPVAALITHARHVDWKHFLMFKK